MKWLITGAEGQLAQEFSSYLSLHKENFKKFNRIDLDIRDLEHVSKTLKINRPDILINCASWTQVDFAESNIESAYSINSEGVANLSKEAKKINAKFFHFSTDSVFNGQENIPRDETSKTSPISIYGKSKVEGEERALEIYPSSTYVIRTAWLYGEFGTNFVKWFLKEQLSNKKSRIAMDHFGQPTWSKDLVEAVYLLAKDSFPPGIYHITNKGSTSWFNFAKTILKICRMPMINLEACTHKELNLIAKRPQFSILKNTKFPSVENPITRDWREALLAALPSINKKLKEEI